MQHDLVITNQTMAPARADINAALLALSTLQAGETEPAIGSPTLDGSVWLDTSDIDHPTLKVGRGGGWNALGIYDTDYLRAETYLRAPSFRSSNPSGNQQLQLGAGTALDFDSNVVWLRTRLSGTALDNDLALCSPHSIIVSDIAKAGGASGQIDGLLVFMAPGTGFEGGRTAIQARLGVTGQSGGTAYIAHVALMSTGYSTASQGGTGTGDPADSRGGLFGGNDNVWLASGALNYRGITGREIDVSIETGASAFAKIGLLIVQGATDASRADAAGDDGAIVLANQGGAGTTWRYGLQLGTTGALWPLGVDSTIMGVQLRTFGGSSSPVALHGIDFREVAFQAGGYAFASDGFSVGPAGELLHLADVTADPDGRGVTAAESGTVFTNEGGGSPSAVFTLPAAAAGLVYEFVVQDAAGLTVHAAAGDTIRFAGAVSAAGGYCTSAAVGSAVRLVALNATEWFAASIVGTWSIA